MQQSAQQIPLDLISRPAMGRDDFLISDANQDAAFWIDRWPDWPAPLLILNGLAASGKTHLAAVWQDKAKADNIPPEMLLSKTAQQIAQISEYLVFDGIDPWLGDLAAETTLFHLYNIFKEEQRSFLITMRMPPAQAEIAIPDLASRFRAAPVATIHAPDDDLLSAVLVKLLHDRQIMAGEDVIKYVLPRMERSFAAARDIVAKADSMALAQKRNISVPLMRQVLAEMQNPDIINES